MSMLKVPVSPDDHIQGDEHALVTLVEYGDYECPHCGRAYPIIKEVQNHYGRRLRFVFRNFPLTQIHPLAEPAAETAELAGAHGRFWEMHDGIYEDQDRLSLKLLLELGKLLGLSGASVRSGVNGTPTFFINGVRHDGLYEFEDLVSAIDARMLRAKQSVA